MKRPIRRNPRLPEKTLYYDAPLVPRKRRQAHHMRNIIRHEYHSSHGWAVSLTRQGRHYQRFFGDKGDRKGALERAIRWRDKMLRELPPARKFHFRQKPTATGVVGASRVTGRAPNGKVYASYVATWVDEHGRPRKKSFGVLKYGERQARALAIAYRRRVVEEVFGPKR